MAWLWVGEKDPGSAAIRAPSSQGPVGIDQYLIPLQIALQETWPTPKRQPILAKTMIIKPLVFEGNP